MKKGTYSSFLTVFLLSLVIFFWGCATVGNSKSEKAKALVKLRVHNEKLWKMFDADMAEGKIKTAIEHLKVIYDNSIKLGLHDEAAKAKAATAILTGVSEDDSMALSILQLKKDIPSMDSTVRPLMYLLLAKWYYSYYNQNSWEILNRTPVSDSKSDDILVWDASKIFQEIDSCYDKAFENEELLKQLPISQFSGLFEMGNADSSLRPTVFDFAVYDALNFYAFEDHKLTKSQDYFEIDASSDAFSEAPKFMVYSPKTDNKSSRKFKALSLYKKLLTFHDKSKNTGAFLEADMARLDYVLTNSVNLELSKKQDRYIENMNFLIKNYPENKIVATAYYKTALIYKNRNEPKSALGLILSAKKDYVTSYGAKQCNALEYEIKRKDFNITSNETITPDIENEISISYQNIDSITLSIFKKNREEFIAGSQSYNIETTLDELPNSKPFLKVKFPLKKYDDFLPHTDKIKLPSLKPGFYIVAASIADNLSKKENMISYFYINSSSLALVRNDIENKIVKTFVLNGRSGKPAPGTKANFYKIDYKNGIIVAENPFKTVTLGPTGILEPDLGENANANVFLSVSDGKGSEVFDKNYRYPNYRQNDRSLADNLIFFTDRSLYRPGQKIFFKAVAVSFDRDNKKYSVLPSREIEITLRDANNKEVSSLKLNSNEFGSVYGSFMAPSDRLQGRMSISCDEMAGRGFFNVEEYKRPKFFVKLNKPVSQFKLEDKVSLTGNAATYSGASLDNAVVKYRITRLVNFPPWFWWYYIPQQGSSAQEIANGTTKTDEQGNFSISFLALPDLAVEKSKQPIFNYNVLVDVTDSSGETRSDESVIKLGYTAMMASLSCDEWQIDSKNVKIKISTSTMDGKEISSSGEIKLIKLLQPEKPLVKTIAETDSYGWIDDNQKIKLHLSEWKLGETLAKKNIKTGADGTAEVSFQLKSGAYRAEYTSKDAFGEKVVSDTTFIVLNENSKQSPVNLPSFLITEKNSVEVGGTFKAIWGTGYKTGLAYVQLIKDSALLASYWTKPEISQVPISIPVTERLRGGFKVLVFTVKDNILYVHNKEVDVPRTDKKLTLSIESLRSKLHPGEESSVTLKVKSLDGKSVPAELLASLYDKSLDAFLPHSWSGFSSYFLTENTHIGIMSNNKVSSIIGPRSYYRDIFMPKEYYYPSWPSILDLGAGRMYYLSYQKGSGTRLEALTSGAPRSAAPMTAAPMPAASMSDRSASADYFKSEQSNEKQTQEIKKDTIKETARKDFSETVFFHPAIVFDKNGTAKINFKMPDSLTTWRFMAHAHSQDMKSGYSESEFITQKELMVEANTARFLREGDSIEFAVKATNVTDKDINAELSIDFFDPVTNNNLNASLGHKREIKNITIPAMQSRAAFWRVTIPDGLQLVAYKVSGKSSLWSDAEENVLPVLSRRIAITESMPIWINGPGEKNFTFSSFKGNKSNTLENRLFVVQMTSNPMWYAVQALPYLMEFPHECSEQIFSRIYANTIAQSVVLSEPEIKNVFEVWKKESPSALLSNLEKNQDLKNILLLETPWVNDAQKESESKKNIANLFDEKRIKAEKTKAFDKLKKQQLDDGAWPWFPGGRGDYFITLHILAGFGKLSYLGMGSDFAKDDSIRRAIAYIDSSVVKDYNSIKFKEKNNLTADRAFYLYTRSFFLKSNPIPKNATGAVNYYLSQAEKYSLSLNSPMNEAHISVALKRFDKKTKAISIAESLKQRAISKEELGMYFKEEKTWLRYNAPIETQVALIEMFNEVMQSEKCVQECQKWLLKQKQTQNWKTTKATADAIYALFINNKGALKKDIVSVSVGDISIKPDKVEAGSGFYEKRFDKKAINKKFGDIKVAKSDKGIAWGGVYWQYLEDVTKVAAHSDQPLNIKKEIFLQIDTKSGPVLKSIDKLGESLKPGDLLKVRIELRSDRDMEYLHLCDERPSGTEPLNVISSYKYSSFYYYESTKDTSTNFYIDYLPKGTHVFEYPLRIVHRGDYKSGIAKIQCMYAPEFSSHSASSILKVK